MLPPAGKVALDVALSPALGGDCLADVAVLRVEAEVFGAALMERARGARIVVVGNPAIAPCRTSCTRQ